MTTDASRLWKGFERPETAQTNPCSSGLGYETSYGWVKRKSMQTSPNNQQRGCLKVVLRREPAHVTEHLCIGRILLRIGYQALTVRIGLPDIRFTGIWHGFSIFTHLRIRPLRPEHNGLQQSEADGA